MIDLEFLLTAELEVLAKNPPVCAAPKVKKLPITYTCPACLSIRTTSGYIPKKCPECRKIKKPKMCKPYSPKPPRTILCMICNVVAIQVSGPGANKKLCPACKAVRLQEYRAQELKRLHSDPEYRRKIYDSNNARELRKRRAEGKGALKDYGERQKKLAAERRAANPTKICKVCATEKSRANFSKGTICNACHSFLKAAREKHPTHPKQIARAIESERREILKRFDLFAPERAQAKAATKLRARKKERSSPEGRLSRNISELVRTALKGNKAGWRSSVGWTIEELKAHLEKQFRLGMDWDNYGEWHLDHIKPRSMFSFTSPHDPEFKECWALSNLQPLWKWENLSKNNTYPCPYHGQMLI